MSEKQQIFELIPKVMEAIGYVKKGKQTTSGASYKYRGIDDAMNALHSALVEHKVTPSVKVRDVTYGHMTIQREHGTPRNVRTCALMLDLTLAAPDGSSVTNTTAGYGEDDGDKAAGKAMSYAMKYAIFNGLVLPVEPGVLADPDEHGGDDTAAPKSSVATKTPPRASKPASGAAKAIVAPVATASGEIPRGAMLKEQTDEELMLYSADDLLALFGKATASGQTAYAARIKAVGVKVREHESRTAGGKLPM